MNIQCLNKSMVLFLVGVFAAFGECAGNVVTWTGGAGDNRYSNAENWDPQEVPDYLDEIHIPSGDWRIVFNSGERFYGKFYIDDGSGKVVFEGGEGGTTLNTSTGADLRIGEGRNLVVADGLTLMLHYEIPLAKGTLTVRSGGSAFFNMLNDALCTIGGSARVFVEEGGSFLNNKAKLSITNNAEVVVSGGLMHTKYYCVYGPDAPEEKGALLRITGGTLWNDWSFAYTTRIYPGGRFENLGGTVLWGASSDSSTANLVSNTNDPYAAGDYGFASFLPPKGSCLNLLSYADGGALNFGISGDYAFGGEIFATNTAANAEGTPGFLRFGANAEIKLTGKGTVYANGLEMKANSSKVDIDVSAIYLGGGGILQQGINCETHFREDLVLGAWDDWSAVRGSNGRFTFAGDLVFDTLNCFDKTTTHSISLKAGFIDVTSIDAGGGGTVALYPNIYNNVHPAWPILLNSLVVGDDTSLFITNSTETIRTASFKLGENATLVFDLAENRYVDVLGDMELGGDARIVVKLPASLAEGKIYPVFCAPAGSTIPDGLVELEGTLPGGWSIVKRSNLVYLSDGEVAYAKDPSEFYKRWTGALNGDFATPGNWAKGECPNDFGMAQLQNDFAIFGGTKRIDVNVASPVRTYGISMDEGAGPFILAGETISIYSPLNENVHRQGSEQLKDASGVVSRSDLPWIIYNEVVHDLFESREIYTVTSYLLGSISLMGDNPKRKDLSEFYFSGDIRIGGDWTVSHFNVCTNSHSLAAKRPHTLSLLPGASLSVLNQVQDFDLRQQFLVSPSASLTIVGSVCRFLEPNLHFINGTVTVEGVLDARAKQTFSGEGTAVFRFATGELSFKGGMTIILGSLENDVTVSLKGEPVIAPAGDWTFGGGAELELDDHSVLTLATGGHRLTLEKPIVSKGALAVTGAGTVEIAAAGMSLGRVTMADGAKFALAAGLDESSQWVKVLKVREDDESIAFDVDDPSMVRKITGEDGCTTYFVKHRKGMILIVR